tara:strand:- start:34 stop:267 length:234 start_codon:yes stop_codon:yes gene_type:complete
LDLHYDPFVHLHQKLSQRSMIDRNQLQNDYIERIIDGMDHRDLWQYVYDSLEQNFDRYSEQELVTEVEDYYPDLLED